MRLARSAMNFPLSWTSWTGAKCQERRASSQWPLKAEIAGAEVEHRDGKYPDVNDNCVAKASTLSHPYKQVHPKRRSPSPTSAATAHRLQDGSRGPSPKQTSAVHRSL
jgi:hypothetical protein